MIVMSGPMPAGSPSVRARGGEALIELEILDDRRGAELGQIRLPDFFALGQREPAFDRRARVGRALDIPLVADPDQLEAVLGLERPRRLAHTRVTHRLALRAAELTRHPSSDVAHHHVAERARLLDGRRAAAIAETVRS